MPDANARNGIINGVNVGVNPAIAPVLQLYPLPTRQTAAQAAQGIGRVDVTNDSPGHENYFVGRVDYTITNIDQPVRALHRRPARRCSSRTRARRFRCGTATTIRSNHYVTAELRQVVTPTMANTLRFGVTRTEEEATRTDLDNGLLVFFPGRRAAPSIPGPASSASAAIRCCRSRSGRRASSSATIWSGAAAAIR